MMADPEQARRRQEILREFLVELMNYQAQADALELKVLALKKRLLQSYLQLDDAMDQEP